MKCPNCNNENNDNRSVCSVCGASLAAGQQKQKMGRSMKLALLAPIAVLLALGVMITVIAVGCGRDGSDSGRISAEELKQAKEDFVPPAEIFDVSTAAVNPDIRFTYDDRARITSCLYEVNGRDYELAYTYDDEKEELEITTYYKEEPILSDTFPYEQLPQPEGGDTFGVINGYFVQPVEPTGTDKPTSDRGKAEDYVTAVREYDLPFSGWFQLTDEHFESGTYTVSRMPYLEFDSDDADDVNLEISEKYNSSFDYAEDIEQKLASGEITEESVFCDKIDYAVYLNKDILSLVIEARTVNSPASFFSVYNFDLSTGDLLDNREVVALSDISFNEATGRIREEIEDAYVVDFEIPESSRDIFEKTKTDSLSDENLESAYYYFNEDGKLTSAYHYYWFAGGGNVNNIVVLDAGIQ